MKKIYLDYNATTPVDPAVREAMLPYLGDIFGNPSSLHWAGARSKKAMEETREKAAGCLGCSDREILFTSGGTEGDNLAIQGVIDAWRRDHPDRRPHVVTTAIEHQAVLKTLEALEARGRIEVTKLPVDKSGDINLEELEQGLLPNTALISAMFANNEIGNVYPVNAIGRIARERGIPFHSDAVQAVGKLPIDLSRLPIDLLSFSSHKICGPKGAGGLYVRKGMRIEPLLHGGSQERSLRGGTENLPGIVGLGEAMVVVHRDLEAESRRQTSLRDRLQKGLAERVPGICFYGNEDHRLCNTLNVGLEGIQGQTLLIALDREGIAASSGSACASGALEPSHVLMAMGVPQNQAKGAVRFSLGRRTTEEEIDSVLERLPRIVRGLRSH